MDIKTILERLEKLKTAVGDADHDEDCECECGADIDEPFVAAVDALILDIEIDLRRTGVELVTV